LNEEIMALLLHAENEYHSAVMKAAREAEHYAADRKKKQHAYFEQLRREWERFEKSENEKLEKTLAEVEHKLEKDTAQMKRQLKASQEKKAGQISERLKEEVLSLYGSR